MSTTADSDRRRHPRIILKAFGFKTKCQFTVESAKTDVTLIDLSPGGARLKTIVAAPREKAHS
ncbi:PilZ domain-containing protein [Desulfovibrio ferrophilus]|uniref:Type IV pilus assembly PilZ n=1 Tax=Desulfovibrio ferrophilus TaxID=241368 RepID=A0A2Z6B2J7_9BACT|nr:PilZ domain-containing protein [Desulfovibrio ferrophilus]BBD09650.1 type IV pilus assembly PilZ [Desulfovibrio ferrophilus]